MAHNNGGASKSSCAYPIVIIEHSLRGGLYGCLAGLVFCRRPQYLYKTAKVTLLGAGWAYMAEYSRCSFREFLPWTSEKATTAWIPGALAGFIAGSTVATAYRPVLQASEVAAFTAFSAITYAMSGYAEWFAEYTEYRKKGHMHAFHK